MSKFYQIFIFLIIIFIMGYSPDTKAQTYSSEEVEVSGIAFSRFALKIKPDESVYQEIDHEKWIKMVDKNLCWSGIFLVFDSNHPSCRANTQQADMNVVLKIRNSDSKKSLNFIISDNKNLTLFQWDIPFNQNQLHEESLIDSINELTRKITGVSGILGSTIAFELKQPMHKKVIVRVNTHGYNLTSISHNQSISILPRWSPNGRGILYTTISRHGTSVVYDNMAGKIVILAKYQGINSGGTWYANGQQIIITLSKGANADLYGLTIQNRKLTRLTSHPAIDTAPSLSANAQYLLFISDRSGREQIYVKYMETGAIFRLTFDGIRNTDPVWSPDGSLIVFTKTIKGRDQIHIMDPFGENVRALTRGNFHSQQPAWSPDGKQIVFSSNRSGDYKLYVMFIDGSGIRRLSNTPKGFQESSPNWTSSKF